MQLFQNVGNQVGFSVLNPRKVEQLLAGGVVAGSQKGEGFHVPLQKGNQRMFWAEWES